MTREVKYAYRVGRRKDSRGLCVGRGCCRWGTHLTGQVRGVKTRPAIPTEQASLPPGGFIFVGAVLGGGKAKAIPGKHAVEVVHNADTHPMVLPQGYPTPMKLGLATRVFWSLDGA